MARRGSLALLLAVAACARGPAPEPRHVPEKRLVDDVTLPSTLPLHPAATVPLHDVARPALAASRSFGVPPGCLPEGESPPWTPCQPQIPREARTARWIILEPGYHPEREALRAKLQDRISGPLPPPAHFLLSNAGASGPPSIAPHEARGLIAHPVPELALRDYASAPFEVPTGAVLRFAIGVEEPAWFVDSAPVQFVIEAVPAKGEAVEVFRESLDPAHREEDRGWKERQVDLERFAGKEISLRFANRPVQDGDQRPQLPLWGDPTVFRPAPEVKRPSIVLVSLDTLRARSLSALGYKLETSPYFAALSRQGALFLDAFTTYSNTLGAHMSMLTGLYPRSHAVTDGKTILAKGRPTLAQLLRAGGYETAAFTEDGLLNAESGFRRGFARYEENKDVHPRGGDSAATFGKALEWAREHRDEPFFLFVHTYEVHAPYVPPERYASLFADSEPANQPTSQRLLYEREIRHLDDELERLVKGLDEIAPGSDLLLVVTADHGEEFWEHGGVAHTKVYDEVMHVPLLFRYPSVVPSDLKIETPVSLIDIVPTVLELVGLPPSSADGTSLVPLLAANPKKFSRATVFAEAPASRQTRSHRQFGARNATHKCIVFEDEPGGACYDLRSDPDERTPLDPNHDAETRALFAEVEAYRRQRSAGPSPRPSGGEAETDERRQEKLRALGYVE